MLVFVFVVMLLADCSVDEDGEEEEEGTGGVGAESVGVLRFNAPFPTSLWIIGVFEAEMFDFD